MAAIAFLAVPVWAQRSASLAGRILDVTGGGVAGAIIAATNEDTGLRRTVESEPGGAYEITSLDPGLYTVKISKDQFNPYAEYHVPLREQAITVRRFVLEVGSVANPEVVVQGSTQPIERTDATVVGQFEHDEMSRLPVNGAKILEYLSIVPGTTITPATRGEPGQFTTNGQRPNANSFTIDGVSANTGVTAGGLPAQSTGGTLPGVSAFGSFDALVSLESVQELQVRTSSSVAEFGRFPGATVSLTTQSGTNGFHGATLFRLRNELGSAANWYADRDGFGKLPQRLLDLTQTFGGPLKRNHTFFFLSYERVQLRETYVWEQPTPSSAQRVNAAYWAQLPLSLFPLPNTGPPTSGTGEWVGASALPAGLTNGAGRIDQALGSRASFFGRYSDSPSYNQFGNVTINHLALRMQSLTLGLNLRPTPNLAFDARVNEAQATTNSSWFGSVTPPVPPPPGAPSPPPPFSDDPNCYLEPAVSVLLNSLSPCSYLVRLTIDGVGQLVSGPEGQRRQRQFHAVESGSWQHNRHQLGFGVDYRSITAIREDAAQTLGIIADSPADLNDVRNLWTYTTLNTTPLTQSVEVRELSLWALDTWQPVNRLTITAGLRWEFSPSPVPSAAQLVADYIYFFDPTTNTASLPATPRALWPTSYSDIAPRLGLAYRLGKDNRTVLRMGGGLYYDSSLSIATDILNGGPLSAGQFLSSRYAPFSTALNYGFMAGLRLPLVWQWNTAVEHAFSDHDTLSAGYVGSFGWSLIRREVTTTGTGLTDLLALTTNNGRSNYNSLQVHYRRHLAHGLDASASYTWSHSLDNDSSDAFLVWAGPGSAPANDRGSSDFDLRQSFDASLVYEFPEKTARGWRRFLSGWAASGILQTRTGFPVTVLQAEDFDGISLYNAFRPSQLLSQPVWISDPSMPGGRGLNPAAFLPTPVNPATGLQSQGTLGRNSIYGFGMAQLDMSLRREFRKGESRSLALSLEAFNVLNTPNFADPVRYLDNPLFGQSTSTLNMMLGTGSPGSGLAPMLQVGGPRAFQLSLRTRF
ncbi:MAG TPA: carboxypeptidase regulatory-like domain-containing protein [Verrucomicrobiae bacterium]|nr:carboxypeptidase regulatory-like domain-containing protein [Verrucomicrobiae bacterium]